MKGNKGITLIALVITIIVLLILAGVSIAMLAGDNSILTRAKDSAAQNDLAEGKDQLALAFNTAQAAYLEDYYKTSTTATSTTITAELGTAGTASAPGQGALAKFYNNQADAKSKGDKFYITVSGTTYTVTSVSDTTVSQSATLTETSGGGSNANTATLKWNNN